MSKPQPPGLPKRQPANAAAAPKAKPLPKDILAALDVEVPPVEAPAGYGVAMGLLVAFLVLITLAYAALVAFLAWLLVWHVYQTIISLPHGPYFLFHLPMALLGGLLLLFLVKPVFFRRRSGESGLLTLTANDEPLLFAFVDKLCAATGANPPAVIEVDCEANAGARRRSGIAGAFDKQLVLRVGLPLAASMSIRQFAGVLAHEFGHFNQSTGMTGSYFVRRMSAFFARIVFERDRLDEKLARLRSARSLPGRIFFRCVGWLIEAARGVLWLMLVTGELLTCGVLRRMEYDADRVEAHIAGCSEFLKTNRLMTFLAIAARRAHFDLADAWEQRRLADDLPRLIVSHARQLAEHRDDILKLIDSEKTNWFDTHPCHTDRVESVRATGAGGLVNCDFAAKYLFKDLAALSKEATRACYRSLVGDALDSGKLVPTAELVEQRSGERESFAALRRFFRAGAAATRPILPGPDAERPARPREDAVLSSDLAAAREEVVSLADPDAAAQYETSNAAAVLGHAKIKFATLFSSGRSVKLRNEAEAELRIHEPQRHRTVKQLIPFEKAARRRLTAALRLAQTPPWADEPTAAAPAGGRSSRTVARLTRLCQALEPHVAKAERLRELALHLRVYYSAYDDAQPYQPLVRRILQANADAIGVLDELKSGLNAIPYPFAHATEGISVGQALIPNRPDPKDPGAVHAASNSAIDQFYDLTYRALAELTQHAERIERGLGLEPLPDLPAPTKKTTDEETANTAKERAEARRNTRQYWLGYSIRAFAGLAMLVFLVSLSLNPPQLPAMGWPSDSGSRGSRSSYEYRPAPFRLSPRAYDPDPMLRTDPFNLNPHAPNPNPNPRPYAPPSYSPPAAYRPGPGGGSGGSGAPSPGRR
jgi:Zn-dependent protease with chaperone function